MWQTVVAAGWANNRGATDHVARATALTPPLALPVQGCAGRRLAPAAGRGIGVAAKAVLNCPWPIAVVRLTPEHSGHAHRPHTLADYRQP